MYEHLKMNFDAPKMRFALMDNFEEIRVGLPQPISITGEDHGGFMVYTSGEQPVVIKEVIAENPHHTWEVIIRLTARVQVSKSYLVYHPHFQPHRVWFRYVLDDEQFVYTGDDLGANYTPEMTRFRVWAPTANQVELLLYDAGDEIDGQMISMARSEKGTWAVAIQKNLAGKFYTYRVHVHGLVREAVDPYAKAVNINGSKGAIVDLHHTNPHGWGSVPRPPMKNYVDAIIYESHIRDLTIARNSGVQHKGKYIGLAEEHSHSPEGLRTALAHIRELGITHLHLLPIMESEFIFDDKDEYNWGYGTNFFFAAEGQYVTNPADPYKRVREFKELIQTLHRNGIRVVLDVVYNHTGRQDPDVERIVPGYYLRRNEEGHLSVGSGVNNDFASERPMARKMIIDSAKYWVSEYHVDGFRFDLMGLHDRETMLKLAEEVHRIDPTILLYGEAWNIPTGGLPFERMMIKNSQHGTPIGIFNDNVRDSLLSGGMAPVQERGFASGKPGLELSMKKLVVGSLRDYDPEHVYNVDYHWRGMEEIQTLAPHETVNYATCHDNFAMRDRLERSRPDVSDEARQRMSMLANGIILTSQGIPFIAGGVEIYKTKFGEENSYESPDHINEIDWSYKKIYYHMFELYQGLINLRKAHPAFRMPTAEQVKAHLHFHQSPEGTVMFTLDDHANGDPWKRILVIYNQKEHPVTVHLPGENWKVAAEDGRAALEPLRTVSGATYEMPWISVSVLFQE